MLAALGLAVGLLALGGHAVVPGWLARRPAGRRLWALASLPLALAAGLAALRTLSAHPDATVAILAAGQRAVALVPRLAAVLWLTLLAADGLLLAGWHRLEPAGWRLLAGFGGACLVAQSLLDELVRATSGPGSPAGPLLVAAACRSLLAVAAGALFLPRRPWLTLLAAAALALHFLALPAPLRLALAQHGNLPTLLAAAAALALAPLMPARLWRPGTATGIVLAALWLASVQATAESLPVPPAPAQLLPPS